ncbi:hypothetical protein BN3661_02190 [Eubacteriaceae bacterium CHKCI005]|nr:hypothetical protein BN3661_02190 [Eubacteriaceae bacterium CHKCI005]
MTDIGQVLIDIRDRACITQRNLALLLGYSETSVANWIRGARYPQPDRISKIQELQNLPTEELRSRLKTLEEKVKSEPKPVPKSKFVLSRISSIPGYPIFKMNGKLYCLIDNCEWRKYGYCFGRGCMKRNELLSKEERHDQKKAGTVSKPL